MQRYKGNRPEADVDSNRWAIPRLAGKSHCSALVQNPAAETNGSTRAAPMPNGTRWLGYIEMCRHLRGGCSGSVFAQYAPPGL